MRKKIFKLLMLLFVLTMSLCFATACIDNGENTNQPSEHVHTFDKQVIGESYVATRATCEQKATYFLSCSCGEKGVKTFSTGEALGHDYGKFQSAGDGTHMKVCKNDSNHIISGECKGGSSTCKQYATCEECDGRYGDLVACQFENGECKWCGQEFYTQGLIFNYSGTSSICYVEDYVGTEKDVVIPSIYNGSPVSFISDIFKGAFYECNVIESVKIPKTIKYIGGDSFAKCTSLRAVTFDNDSQLEEVFGGAFYGCTALTELTLPNSVTSIDAGAFSNCSSLKNLYLSDNLIRVTNYFENCDALQYNEKDNLKYLGSLTNQYVFLVQLKNKQAKSVEIEANCKCIGSNVFFECEELSNVLLPNGLKYIGYSAFADCLSLENVDLPESLIEIDDNAFTRSGLKTIKIPNGVKMVGRDAFRRCESLTNVEISESIDDIGLDSFTMCINLIDISVDENNQNYQSIDGNLYSKEGKLLCQYALGKKETSFVVPNHIEYINEKAFAGCKALENVVIHNNVKEIGQEAFALCTSLQSIEIPNNTKLDMAVFRGCISLTSVVLPGTMEEMSPLMFEGCESLKSIIIPKNCTAIGGFSFSNCVALKSIIIPKGVMGIANSVFQNCVSLTSISFEGTMEEWENITKGEYWNSGVATTFVQCVDGKVNIK